jgi:hypothetical protein
VALFRSHKRDACGVSTEITRSQVEELSTLSLEYTKLWRFCMNQNPDPGIHTPFCIYILYISFKRGGKGHQVIPTNLNCTHNSEVGVASYYVFRSPRESWCRQMHVLPIVFVNKRNNWPQLQATLIWKSRQVTVMVVGRDYHTA